MTLGGKNLILFHLEPTLSPLQEPSTRPSSLKGLTPRGHLFDWRSICASFSDYSLPHSIVARSQGASSQCYRSLRNGGKRVPGRMMTLQKEQYLSQGTLVTNISCWCQVRWGNIRKNKLVTLPSKAFHKLYKKIHNKIYLVTVKVCINKGPGFAIISKTVTVFQPSVIQGHSFLLFPNQDTTPIAFT